VFLDVEHESNRGGLRSMFTRGFEIREIFVGIKTEKQEENTPLKQRKLHFKRSTCLFEMTDLKTGLIEQIENTLHSTSTPGISK